MQGCLEAHLAAVEARSIVHKVGLVADSADTPDVLGVTVGGLQACTTPCFALALATNWRHPAIGTKLELPRHAAAAVVPEQALVRAC